MSSCLLPWAPPAFCVDPHNESGNADNGNDGLTPATPIRDTAEFNNRVALKSLNFVAVVNYMSDDTSGVPVDLGSTDITAGGLFVFVGPTVSLRTGTLYSTQNFDPATRTRQSVDDGSFSFAPFVGAMVQDTQAGPNQGLVAWVMSGTTSPYLSAPYSNAIGPGGFCPGDSYQVQRGGKLAISPNAPGNPSAVIFENFTLAAGSGFAGAQYRNCSFLGPLTAPASQLNNCYLSSGISTLQTGEIDTIAGGIVTTATDRCNPILRLSNHIYVTGNALQIQGRHYQAVQIDVNTGAQIQDCATDGVLIDRHVQWDGLVWGNGHGGAGVRMFPNGSLSVPNMHRPNITGTRDIVFTPAPFGGIDITVARGWDDTAGTYTSTRDATWDNLYASIASGGFGYCMRCLQNNAVIVCT